MPTPQFSDEPRTLDPKGRNYRLPLIILFALLLIGVVAYIPLMNAWKEEQSHLAERGQYQGALYTLDLDGQETSIELAWAGPHLAVAMDAPPTPETVVQIQGSFGTETLTWNDEYSVFGPTEATLDPYGHHKVKLTFESGDEVLWSGKLWAWGIHSHDHHH
ncbi:hypothetical protein [Puniceicoccus vermicola]|uniref:Uncharacterized protein n=1 Tax=Puniceicoccus vermicola TaxID=388746 RepID=A0A7X1E3S0_9BACT|nr:hypothetical protein [Puniceicoccus vermicola]MBC2601835.1 hypothetical protein [Puniceicoccus vermicola]